MPELLLSISRFIRLLLGGHQAVAIENAALRLQLAAFRRHRKRPVLTVLDRLFWTTLRRVWPGWRGTLFYVQPDTVVRWQRASGSADSGSGCQRRPVADVVGHRLMGRFGA
jgi:hypothetical protein